MFKYFSLRSGITKLITPKIPKRINKSECDAYIASFCSFLENIGLFERYKYATVIFISCYPKGTSFYRYVDADNLDTKRALDALQKYFLESDNSYFVSLMHFSEERQCDEAYTEIFLIPQKTNRSNLLLSNEKKEGDYYKIG